MRRRGRWIEAAVTTTASSRPFTSTARCRLTPFVLLAPSQPRLDRGTVSAAGTVGESMIAAVGPPVPPGPPPAVGRAARRGCAATPRCGPSGRTPRTPSRLAGTPSAVAATRYHRARCTGWRPLSHGSNASRVVRRGLPCCPAQPTAARGSPTVRRSPTTSTPRNHVRARGAGTTGMARSAMMALWAPGLGGDLVITDPTRNRLLRFSARHTLAHREFSNTLSDKAQ